MVLARGSPEGGQERGPQDTAGAQARALGQRRAGAQLKPTAKPAAQLLGKGCGRGELDHVRADAGSLQESPWGPWGVREGEREGGEGGRE